jgi:cytochrome c biogenesis protein ResB
MRSMLQRLASTRLAIAGFALLAAALLATHDRADASPWWVVAPLAGLALNLAAAIALRPALRRGGLGVFHVSLLVLLGLAAVGRMTHFDARVEVTEGSAFDASQVQTVSRGRWHGDGWRALGFEQGAWRVAYAPGVKRGRTESTVVTADGSTRTVGDDTPLIIDGYRLYTTHNKGFAPLVTWQADGAAAVTGALHMPSYPLFEWRQENRWQPPRGGELRFWLRIEQPPLVEQAAWTLSPASVPTVLVVEGDGQRAELRPGDAMALAGATLRYERLAGWMGYRIFYDPTLMPLLVTSLAGVLGLAWHLWRRLASAPTARPAWPAMTPMRP